MVIMGGKDGTKAVRDLNVVNIGTAEEPVWALAVDATVTVPEVEVGDVEVAFPTGDNALLKDKTLKDIISEEGLDVNIVSGGGDSEKVVKAEYTETDLVDGTITLTEEASYFEIINKSNENGLSFTINSVAVTLDKKDVDSKGLPLIYSFGDDFLPFTEIGISGTEPSFKAIVKG